MHPFRSKEYLKSVREERCLSCGVPPPVDAHHLRHSQTSGMSRKVEDNWTVPLCRMCHMDCHTRGRESEWWALQGIDALEWARERFEGWKRESEE
jgi:ferredoxin